MSDHNQSSTAGWLDVYYEHLRHTLIGSATVQRDELEGDLVMVDIRPTNPESMSVCWIHLPGPGLPGRRSSGQIVLSVGDTGARDELVDDDGKDAAHLRAVIEAVTAGRVTEIRGPGRSRVELTFKDGRVHVLEWRGLMEGGLAPAPGWREGPPIHFAPYR